MHAQLTVFFGDRPARRFLLDPGAARCVGRENGCDVRLDDDRVSRRHVEFDCVSERWCCRDLGSKNGLRVNGREVARSDLAGGEWLDIGGLLAFFSLSDAARIGEQRERDRQRRETSIELARRIDPARGLARVLGDVLDAVLELADTRRAFLMLDDGGDAFELVAARGMRRRDLEDRVFSGSVGVLRDALSNQSAIVTCDLSALTDYAQRASVVGSGIRAVACVPVTISASRRGLIYTDSDRPGKVFDELDLELLQGFAERAAVAIGAGLLRESLQAVAAELQEPGKTAMTLDELLHVHRYTGRASA